MKQLTNNLMLLNLPNQYAQAPYSAGLIRCTNQRAGKYSRDEHGWTGPVADGIRLIDSG